MKTVQILETSLYVADLEEAKDFYSITLGLDFFAGVPGRHVFFRCGNSMLLLFDPKATKEDDSDIGVPPHGASGAGHACFTMEEDEVHLWRSHLESVGVEIEQEVDWPTGGKSIYFRDPSGNSLELATRKLWGFD